jgi:adenine-specific DNA-methyltransferase
MARYEGRLELTWTNKHDRLLAHEDGSYEWVHPSDYRVAEVRLLHDAATVGDTYKTRARDNLLIRGDALNALTSLARLPEFAREYVGKVKLAYLDPPFNTQQSFLQYEDNLEHSVWLTMIRDRVLQIVDLLAPDGTLWLHLDDSEVAYCRVMLDEVLGRQNFVATVAWQKTLTRRNDAKLLSSAQDYILVYAKDIERIVFNRLVPTAKQRSTYTNRDNDARGDWLAIPFHAPNIRPNLTYPITTPGGRVLMPPPGRCWSTGKDEFEKLLADNRIYFGRDGNGMAQRKKFWSEAEERAGLVPWTWWPYEEVGENREANRESKSIAALSGGDRPFATAKPERLLKRIIETASQPDDIVLDCFVGSGTTAAVAHKMRRRWVAIEREPSTLEEFAVPRLSAIVSGNERSGVTHEVDWTGGGGFRVLDVAPSMFEADAGLVFLAEWMTNGALAEATAAQLGFTYQDTPPFAGRKGRSRLAVVDGIVNESVVRLLVTALPENERVVVRGTAIDPEARSVLQELRPGSTMAKIPASLLEEYRASPQLRLDLLPPAPQPASSDNGEGAALATTSSTT